MLVLSVLLHEFCHALAAWACGYVVTSFGIGSGEPLLCLRLPQTGTIFYVCRFGLRFSGVTWLFSPGGTPRHGADLLLACAGSLGNALMASVAGYLLSAAALPSVPFLTVWVPIVVVLLVNSVLALLFFLPQRTVSAEQGALTSDGLQALSILFPARFAGGRGAGAAVGVLRTLAQKRAFWSKIGDTTMLCVALLRAAEASEEIGDQETTRACLHEAESLPVIPGAGRYQQAWTRLLAVRLQLQPIVPALNEVEALFTELGSEAGKILVARERLLHLAPQDGSDRDSAFVALQSAAFASRNGALALILLADRIDLQGQRDEADFGTLEALASQYEAARRDQESSLTDLRVYAAIADARARNGDDGGAAIAYERAIAASRRVSVALGFDPALQNHFTEHQLPLTAASVRCFGRLGRTADAARYADLLRQ